MITVCLPIEMTQISCFLQFLNYRATARKLKTFHTGFSVHALWFITLVVLGLLTLLTLHSSYTTLSKSSQSLLGGITSLLTPRKPHPPKFSAGEISNGQSETRLQPIVGGRARSSLSHAWRNHTAALVHHRSRQPGVIHHRIYTHAA